MPKRTDKIEEKLETFEKKDLALRKTIAKRLDRLDSSQNAFRVVEQTIGGKLVEKKRHSN